MKPLTILFDADDTVENLCDCWIALLNERYGTSVRIEDVTDWDIALAFQTLTSEQVFCVINENELFHRLLHVPGFLEILHNLYVEGNKIYMVPSTILYSCYYKVMLN